MGNTVPFSELSESEQQHINDNIDDYLPITNKQLSIERDVLGAMLFAETTSTAKLKNLVPKDFRFARTRHIYQMMRDISGHRGRFNPEHLLGDNNEINEYILNIMNDAITTNAKAKCDWLVEQSIKSRG